jgi:hypothetical protein
MSTTDDTKPRFHVNFMRSGELDPSVSVSAAGDLVVFPCGHGFGPSFVTGVAAWRALNAAVEAAITVHERGAVAW